MEVNITAWKALLFKDRVNRLAPIHWDIDLTSVCNHRCPGCFYIGLPEDGFDASQGVFREVKNGILPTDLVLRTVKDIPKVGGKAITFVGGGEPTLHPKIIDIFKEVKANNLKFGLISHLGLNYKPEFFEALLPASWVRVSTNAATAKTYSKMQGIKEDEFNRVCNNISHFSQLGGRIGVSFLIHPDNVHEISWASIIFSKLGARYIQYKPYITDKHEHLWAGYEDDIEKELKKAKTYETPIFKVVDQFVGRKQQLLDYWHLKPCGKCWVARFNPKITANGKVYQCCELAYSDTGILGDLNVNTLEEMINSGSWEKAEKDINTDKCPPCWERDLNRSINDGSFHSMKPPPETLDAEFI